MRERCMGKGASRRAGVGRVRGVDFFSILLGTGGRSHMHFNARVVLIDVFGEVGFDDTVVIDAESLAEGILRDLEPAVDVSSQGRSKIEPDGKGEPLRLESCQ